MIGGYRHFNADIDTFHRARQDVRAEERLVLVDSDAPEACVLRRAERAETATARDREDHVRVRLDLVVGDVLTEVLLHEVVRVAAEDCRTGDALLRAGLIAGEEDVHRRDLNPHDGADDRLRLVVLRDERSHATDEVAALIGRIRQALDVVNVDPLEVRVQRA